MRDGMIGDSYLPKKRIRIVRGIVLLLVLTGGIAVTVLLAMGKAPVVSELLNRCRYIPEKPPVAFGVFHLIWLCSAIVLTGLALKLGIRTAQKEESAARVTDSVLFWVGLILLLSEIWKQWYSCFVTSGGVYDFGVFPFQFCTLPMVAALLASLMPEGNRKRGIIAFLPLYGTIGGLAVMCYPSLSNDWFLASHSMFWHSALMIAGGYLITAAKIGKRFSTEWFPGAHILTVGLAVSLVLNEALEPLTAQSPHPINLFYLSRKIPNHYIVVGDAQRAFGWWAGVLAYWILFLVGAALLWCTGALGRYISHSRARKKTNS